MRLPDAQAGDDLLLSRRACECGRPGVQRDSAIRERIVLKPAKLPRAPADAVSYRLDIVLQGEDETPFFLD